jgi:predicted enzyme related to lactoylglutathione lyase
MAAALLGTVWSAPLYAADAAPPEVHPGKVVFLELVTPDLAAAKAFYAGLFGWTYRDSEVGDPRHAEASLAGHIVAELVYKPVRATERRQPAWLTFIAARDVDATAREAARNGGKILFAPATVPGLGREAVLADPQGAVFAVLAQSGGDAPDVLADPGDWIWASLLASDPDTDAAFYQALFGYEVFDLPAGPGTEHYILSSGDYARASVNTLPARGPGIHPHWLNFVRVDDAAASARKAEALGGHVLVQPHADRHGGRIAVVSDPSGAPFGLMEWQEGGSE